MQSPKRQSPGRMRIGVVLDQGSHMPVSERNTKLWRQLARKLATTGVTDVRIEVPMAETLYIGDPRRHRSQERRVLRNIAILREQGLEVEAVVGFGSTGALPADLSVEDDDYIERVSQNVRDVVRTLKRYGVHRFQIENELNTAGQAALMQGWRSGARWWDWDFKRDLMRSLSSAAREANPKAVLTTNLFDGAMDPFKTPKKPSTWDVTKGFFARSSTFESAISELGQFVDEIGIDAYPNYIAPYSGGWDIGKPPEHVRPDKVIDPMARLMLAMVRPVWKHIGARPGSAIWPLVLGMTDPAAHIEKRIELYRRVLPDKTVYVAETGVPSQSTLGHTPGGQALFVESTLAGAQRAGAARTMIYHLYDPTEEDHLEFGMPGERLENGARNPGLFGLDANHPEQHEGTFGVLDEKGRAKRATITRKELVFERWLPRIRTQVREVSAWDVIRDFLGGDSGT